MDQKAFCATEDEHYICFCKNDGCYDFANQIKLVFAQIKK